MGSPPLTVGADTWEGILLLRHNLVRRNFSSHIFEQKEENCSNHNLKKIYSQHQFSQNSYREASQNYKVNQRNANISSLEKAVQ